ncbi:hypothetical protein J2129_002168 [Methanofollis sp. W23]|nr:hypothetical protein [Methanofollis sp. W23]
MMRSPSLLRKKERISVAGGVPPPKPPATRYVKGGSTLFMAIYSAFPSLSWSRGSGRHSPPAKGVGRGVTSILSTTYGGLYRAPLSYPPQINSYNVVRCRNGRPRSSVIRRIAEGSR